MTFNLYLSKKHSLKKQCSLINYYLIKLNFLNKLLIKL